MKQADGEILEKWGRALETNVEIWGERGDAFSIAIRRVAVTHIASHIFN